MVDGREEDRNYDVTFVGYCWVLESLKRVAGWACWFLDWFLMFSMVWCVFFSFCASCTPCYRIGGMVQLEE